MIIRVWHGKTKPPTRKVTTTSERKRSLRRNHVFWFIFISNAVTAFLIHNNQVPETYFQF